MAFPILLLLGIFVHGASLADSDLPIFISGELELRDSGEVVAGSGSKSDPFVISGLSIVASGYDYGMTLENIESYVVIMGCEVCGADSKYARGGIVLSNCSNVTIRGCYLHNNRVGVMLAHCEGVRITGNRLVSNSFGVVLDVLSRNNEVISNYFDNDTNAKASAPNTWNQQGRGNCWSDFSGDAKERTPAVYRISNGNIDLSPRGVVGCSLTPISQPGAPSPIIKLLGDNPIPVVQNTTYIDPGATATDSCGNDLTDAIIATSNVDTSVVGTYEVTYCFQATDSHDCVCVQRIVKVLDTQSPVIRLLGPNPTHVQVGSTYLDPGATASDSNDGDLTERLEVDSDVDTSLPGTYQVTYRVKDLAENEAQIARKVFVGQQAVVSHGEWPLEATAQYSEDTNRRKTLSIQVRCSAALSEYLYPLYLARIILHASESLPGLTDSEFRFSIADELGELMSGTVPAGIGFEKTETLVPTALLTGMTLEFLRKGCCINYADPPTSASEVQRRASAIGEHHLGKETPITASVIPVLLDNGGTGYQVSILYKDSLSNDDGQLTLAQVRNSTLVLQLSLLRTLGGSVASISVTVFLDLYGLIYKNDLPLASIGERVQALSRSAIRSLWKESYIHPLLQ